jgi:hypothetical protein
MEILHKIPVFPLPLATEKLIHPSRLILPFFLALSSPFLDSGSESVFSTLSSLSSASVAASEYLSTTRTAAAAAFAESCLPLEEVGPVKLALASAEVREDLRGRNYTLIQISKWDTV